MMRKIETANTNSSESKVFDVNLLTREPFELSRLEGFVDGNDDIFDVLANKRQETSRL